MKIPSFEYCNHLWVNHNVPFSVRRHCETVTKVGVMLARHLQRAGVEIDVKLVEIGCRVHDAFKPISLSNEDLQTSGLTQEAIDFWNKMRTKYTSNEGRVEHETIVAARELNFEFPEFSENFVKNIGSTNNPCYLNKELTYGLELRVSHYADWRVQFDQIISFDDRLEYLHRTWFNSSKDEWEMRKSKEKALEKEIFDHLTFTPDELEQTFTQEMFDLIFA